MSALKGLGISVKLKMDKDIKLAAREVPELNRTGNRFTSVLDAANITAQTIAVAGIFTLIGYVLWTHKKGK